MKWMGRFYSFLNEEKLNYLRNIIKFNELIPSIKSELIACGLGQGASKEWNFNFIIEFLF